MKKKILIIVENAPVPPDLRVWNEAIALRNAGYSVTVLSPTGHGFKRGYELRDGIHIYRHPIPDDSGGIIGYVWEYVCALFWQVFYSWWIFLRRGFHAIHGCNPPDTIFLAALPFKLFGVRFIFDHHDVNPELYEAKYGRKDIFYRGLLFFERMTFRCADVVLATNESYRQIAIGRGGKDPKDVFIVRNGPDLDTLKVVTPNPRLKRGKPYLVGYVGNMAIQDGLDILVEAAQYIKNSGRNDIYFICIGGGPAFQELQGMIDEKELRDIMNFTGRIPEEEKIEILSTADICVNPDRPCQMNDLSTMIKIMEYMAFSKPIVQFDLKEGRVSAGQASLYCDKENQVADFADKICWLADHPEEREKMGEIGRIRVETELAWKYSVVNLLKAYDWALREGYREITASSDTHRVSNKNEHSSAINKAADGIAKNKVI